MTPVLRRSASRLMRCGRKQSTMTPMERVRLTGRMDRSDSCAKVHSLRVASGNVCALWRFSWSQRSQTLQSGSVVSRTHLSLWLSHSRHLFKSLRITTRKRIRIALSLRATNKTRRSACLCLSSKQLTCGRFVSAIDEIKEYNERHLSRVFPLYLFIDKKKFAHESLAQGQHTQRDLHRSADKTDCRWSICLPADSQATPGVAAAAGATSSFAKTTCHRCASFLPFKGSIQRWSSCAAPRKADGWMVGLTKHENHLRCTFWSSKVLRFLVPKCTKETWMRVFTWVITVHLKQSGPRGFVYLHDLLSFLPLVKPASRQLSSLEKWSEFTKACRKSVSTSFRWQERSVDKLSLEFSRLPQKCDKFLSLSDFRD